MIGLNVPPVTKAVKTPKLKINGLLRAGFKRAKADVASTTVFPKYSFSGSQKPIDSGTVYHAYVNKMFSEHLLSL